MLSYDRRGADHRALCSKCVSGNFDAVAADTGESPCITAFANYVEPGVERGPKQSQGLQRLAEWRWAPGWHLELRTQYVYFETDDDGTDFYCPAVGFDTVYPRWPEHFTPCVVGGPGFTHNYRVDFCGIPQ